KCDSAMGVMPFPEFGLREEIESIRQELISLRSQRDHEGALIVPNRIAWAAIFLRGGQTVDVTTAVAYEKDIHEKWPDIMLFLEAGILIVKEYEPTGGLGGYGRLHFLKPQGDALLCFTHELLLRITERSETIRPPLNLLRYVHSVINLQQFGRL